MPSSLVCEALPPVLIAALCHYRSILSLFVIRSVVPFQMLYNTLCNTHDQPPQQPEFWHLQLEYNVHAVTIVFDSGTRFRHTFTILA